MIDPDGWLLALWDLVEGLVTGPSRRRAALAEGQAWALEAAHAVAAAHGLEVDPRPGPGGARRLDGLADGRWWLALEVWPVATTEACTLQFAGSIRSAPASVTFGPARPGPEWQGLTGDDAFDAVAVASGPGPLWWSSETRAAVARCVGTGGALRSGVLHLDGRGDGLGTKDVLAAVRAALDAASAVAADRRDVHHVLARDPVVAVRLRALRALLGGTGLDDDALAALGADPVPEVALAAATARGPRGRDQLRALLATSVGGEAALLLAPAIAPGTDPAFDVAIARSLAEAPTARLVAVAGERCGVGVVPALRRLGGALHADARDAVARIQARSPGERGGLALSAEGVAGALSPAPDAAGGLSATVRS